MARGGSWASWVMPEPDEREVQRGRLSQGGRRAHLSGAEGTGLSSGSRAGVCRGHSPTSLQALLPTSSWGGHSSGQRLPGVSPVLLARSPAPSSEPQATARRPPPPPEGRALFVCLSRLDNPSLWNPLPG